MRDLQARFGERRFRRAAVCFQGPDGIIFARPRVGALQGYPWAVEVSTRDMGTVFQEVQKLHVQSGDPTAE
eukprot:9457565-Pyramimonas_sp.AAC.1